jgi:glutamyl endopeptidase
LIAPTVVVTAGHCVFSHKRLLTGRRAAPARIRVTPGRNGAVAAAPFGSQWAVRWYVNRHFAARADRQCDYGVVVLRRPFIRLRIGFRLAPQSDAALRQLRQTGLLHIAGYPSDKKPGTQWAHHERLDRSGPRRLHYSIDTCPGHSGAPVWLKPGGDGSHAVIAIHTAGPPTSPEGPWGCRPGAPLAPQGMSNVGIRVTADVVRNIANAARGRTRSTAMVRLDRR